MRYGCKASFPALTLTVAVTRTQMQIVTFSSIVFISIASASLRCCEPSGHQCWEECMVLTCALRATLGVVNITVEGKLPLDFC